MMPSNPKVRLQSGSPPDNGMDGRANPDLYIEQKRGMVAVKDHRFAARQFESAARIANQPWLKAIDALRAERMESFNQCFCRKPDEPRCCERLPAAVALAKYICLG